MLFFFSLRSNFKNKIKESGEGKWFLLKTKIIKPLVKNGEEMGQKVSS